MKKRIDTDSIPAGDKLDMLVASNVYKGKHCTTWFVKDKKKVLYLGPKFSTDINDAMKALATFIKNNTMLSYRLDEQLENGPYSCTAEFRFPSPLTGVRYSRSWASTLPLAIARVLAKAPDA